jgi:putative transposase
MQYSPGNLLHIYNRGNNKQQIFFTEDNCRFFTDKINKHIKPYSDILAYCLMPNHFHLLLHVNENSCILKKIGSLESTELHNGFRMLQSSYAKAINKQFDRTGSIFQQNTKFKLLNEFQADNAHQTTYAEVCFHYIHQNPLKAGLVNKLEDWNFSSFKEYLYDKNELCNKMMAFQLFDIQPDRLYNISYAVLKPEFLEKIF